MPGASRHKVRGSVSAALIQPQPLFWWSVDLKARIWRRPRTKGSARNYSRRGKRRRSSRKMLRGNRDRLSISPRTYEIGHVPYAHKAALSISIFMTSLSGPDRSGTLAISSRWESPREDLRLTAPNSLLLEAALRRSARAGVARDFQHR